MYKVVCWPVNNTKKKGNAIPSFSGPSGHVSWERCEWPDQRKRSHFAAAYFFVRELTEWPWNGGACRFSSHKEILGGSHKFLIIYCPTHIPCTFLMCGTINEREAQELMYFCEWSVRRTEFGSSTTSRSTIHRISSLISSPTWWPFLLCFFLCDGHHNVGERNCTRSAPLNLWVFVSGARVPRNLLRMHSHHSRCRT